MEPREASGLIHRFASLQRALVQKFLEAYEPEDRERFRDVLDGELPLNGKTWTHRRHGLGVVFVDPDGVRVNAHVAMVEHPAGLDAGRLVEYMESMGIVSVVFDNREYQVARRDLDDMLSAMARAGLLRDVVASGRFSQRIFELAAGMSDDEE